jgi:hypothetical protein
MNQATGRLEELTDDYGGSTSMEFLI